MSAAPARSLALLAWVAAGLGIGLAVDAVFHSQAGWLAVPLLVAIGWLRVADPTQCERKP